ncbi:hypothetical protein A7982_13712 [Minicystis rosea]|nr:hypothetical protein A7982_13712 [Minicystis rosea]
MQDTFTIHAPAIPSSARLAGFHGREGLSRLYQFDVFLVMTNDAGHHFDIKSAVGGPATLRLERADGRPSFLVNGVFASMELVADFLGRSVFRGVLVPRFWHLTRSLHGRIFTQQTIPQILASVLDKGGLAGKYTMQLIGSYPTEEHVCQYHESDFDFVSRWMEREGLYYFFEQHDEEERLVITDDKSIHRPLGDRFVRYFPHAQEVVDVGDCFRAFTCRAVSLPASVQLKDYDYARPTFEVAGGAPVSPAGVARVNVHGARFFTPDDGARLAQIKAQSLLAGEVVYHGSGAAPDLRSGYLFELEDHPRAAFNTKYLATQIEHWVNQLPGTPELSSIMTWDDAYRVEASAILATVQFRAPQQTAWPRIYGGEHAVIDGPATSEYAQIDSHGRYAVKFHFDESDLSGGKASTWVRMLQPHGGGIEGFHFPLRAGTEVVCTFTGGDPDRPCIVGVAPNALTPSPVTSGNNTRNVIQTGGRNRLEIEDRSGVERITLSTPHTNTYIRMGAPNADHNFHMHTNGNTLLDQGENLDIQVGKDFTEYVMGTTTETHHGVTDIQYDAAVTRLYKDNRTETVEGESAETNNKTRTLTVLGNTTETYEQDRVMTVKGKYITYVTKNAETTTTGNFTNIIHGSQTTDVHGELKSIARGVRITRTEGVSINNVLGLAISAVEGGSVSNTLLGSVSAVEGGALNAVAGVRANFTWGPQFSWNVGATTSMVTGLVFNTLTGSKLEFITGIKAEYVAGFALKHETVRAVTAEAALANNTVDVRNEQLSLARQTFGVKAVDLLLVV